jgi:hypothetical protein
VKTLGCRGLNGVGAIRCYPLWGSRRGAPINLDSCGVFDVLVLFVLFVFSLICCVRGSPRYLESVQAVLVLFIKWDEMLFRGGVTCLRNRINIYLLVKFSTSTLC